MSITLIGMSGSGKSFIGKKLAAIFGCEFIDPDKVLEQEYGLPLQRILEKLGDKIFIERESQITIALTENKDDFIIAPGGSIIYSQKAMEHLKKISSIVYLKTTFETIKQRIGINRRGIVGTQGKTLAEIFQERIPLYERWADKTVDANQDPEIIAKEIS